ncbi:histidine-type phosphatase [Pseudoduganella sp. FT55W]|uniref:Multiple inositol polyphosphate phosphatase 1 n=1 Tax=Duganella rivi TaxID=2666083 RepID=A0A7X4KBL1_9BURK|nr:histidine-type phosphatase [Duganella rivi]MYM66428.1 histidine-type phosphatase [Duganella rivi]
MIELALSLLLATKTPYAPQQDSATYEAAPDGFKPVYTEMLARHGSRGLTSPKTAHALLDVWRQAAAQNALTPLGRALGPDIELMMQANAKIGYGNETAQGLEEHTQLAKRLYARMPQPFDGAAGGQRRILVVSSGKDRAVDSGGFFVRSLVQQQPALAAQVDTSIDRSTLYFHKLNARDDAQVTESSLAYQRWARSDELKAREAAIHAQPRLRAAVQATLARLFTPAFIAAQDATETALALYQLYAAAADMRAELQTNFTRYMPPEHARVYAEAEDAAAFYEKGPGITENGDVTWRMASSLLDDFFNEADAITAGNHAHAAKLRFAHAEIVIPMASALGIPGMSEQLPRAAIYSYDNSPWRGAAVAPMAANIQWDIYQDTTGRTLIRMLYNERETSFKSSCDYAKISSASHFYDYRQLKRCYK